MQKDIAQPVKFRISSATPQDIRLLNQNKDSHNRIVIGKRALKECGISQEAAKKLIERQCRIGSSLILEVNSKKDLAYWRIIGVGQAFNFPLEIIQQENLKNKSNELKNKYHILIKIQYLLENYRQEILNKDSDKRTAYENALLNVRWDTIYQNCLAKGRQPLSACEALHEALLYDINISPVYHKGPWFIITFDKRGDYLFVHGKNQAVLMNYLCNSQYLEAQHLHINAAMDLSGGWQAVIKRQQALLQPVSKKTIDALRISLEISQLYEDYILNDGYAKQHDVQVLTMQRIELEHALDALIPLNKNRGFTLFNKNNKKKIVLLSEINNVCQEIDDIKQEINKMAHISYEAREKISRKIAFHIENRQQFQQTIPLGFYLHYIFDLKEKLIINKDYALTKAQTDTIWHVIVHCETFKIMVPEQVMNAYLGTLEVRVLPQEPIFEFELLAKLQGVLKSNSLKEWLQRHISDAISISSHEEAVTTVLGVGDRQVQKAMSELVRILVLLKQKSKKDRKSKADDVQKIFYKIAMYIENYPDHQQKIPGKLLGYYFKTLDNVLESEPVDEVILSNHMNNITTVLKYSHHLKPKIPLRLMKYYIDVFVGTSPPESIEDTLKFAQKYIKSEFLNQWLLNKYLRPDSVHAQSMECAAKENRAPIYRNYFKFLNTLFFKKSNEVSEKITVRI